MELRSNRLRSLRISGEPHSCARLQRTSHAIGTSLSDVDSANLRLRSECWLNQMRCLKRSQKKKKQHLCLSYPTEYVVHMPFTFHQKLLVFSVVPRLFNKHETMLKNACSHFLFPFSFLPSSSPPTQWCSNTGTALPASVQSSSRYINGTLVTKCTARFRVPGLIFHVFAPSTITSTLHAKYQ